MSRLGVRVPREAPIILIRGLKVRVLQGAPKSLCPRSSMDKSNGFLIHWLGVRIPSGIPYIGGVVMIQPVKFNTKEDLYRFSELASQ